MLMNQRITGTDAAFAIMPRMMHLLVRTALVIAGVAVAAHGLRAQWDWPTYGYE